MNHVLAPIAERFQRFAERECLPASPFYATLSAGIAADPVLLALADTGSGRGQPLPNLLLATVQYLLLGGIPHALATYYPALGGHPSAPGDPVAALSDFCAQHTAAIHALLRTRLVQTNEVRRCALTMPALAQAAANRPVALLEVGASAGLNLLLDQYGYAYGQLRSGDPHAPVQLHCTPHGQLPPIPPQPPRVVWRLGLDLNPIDLHDADAARWLQALIWPEQIDRAVLLRQAIAVAQANPAPIWAGDAIALLPAALAAAPLDALLCLVHTFTLNQFTPEMRARFSGLIATAAQQREIAVVSVEWREPAPPLTLTRWVAGAIAEQRELATCDPHGAWIRWGNGDGP